MIATTTMEDSAVTYEQLNNLSAEFDDADTELIRQDVLVKQPLYAKRHALVSQIPNFWPLVFEQAPPDIDEFIQPLDSSLLLTSLTSLSVSRFEIENGGQGDPRSLSFRFEFNDNDVFEDKVIEKKFWQRRSKSGWSGLVSEPVEIRWKKGKDLTGGLLSTAKKVWDAQQKKATPLNPRLSSKARILTPDERALKKKIENTGLGGVSFFAWFGYVGRAVSAEESAEATEKAREELLARQRQQQQQQEGTSTNGQYDNSADIDVDNDDDDDDDDDDDENENELEIFPEGENLAIAISDDLWPNAIKYFTQAQEQDEVSDDDFESNAGDEKEPMEEDNAYSDEEPPAKRQKT